LTNINSNIFLHVTVVVMRSRSFGAVVEAGAHRQKRRRIMTRKTTGAIAPFRRLCLIAVIPAALAGITVGAVAPAFAEEGTFLLAQAQSQGQDQDRDQDRDQDGTGDQDRDRDRDRDRDWSDADRDRIRDRLRDGSCEQVAEATDEVLGVVRPCLEGGRMRDASCMDRIGLGLEALERTREMCRRN
jgi:hypothetical protein